MNGKKAKALRKKIYGEDGYAGPKWRKYKSENGRAVHGFEFSTYTDTRIATGKRREYQDAKRK